MGLYRAGLYPSFRFFKQLTLSYFQTMLDGRPGCERWRLPGKSREADTPTGSEDPHSAQNNMTRRYCPGFGTVRQNAPR